MSCTIRISPHFWAPCRNRGEDRHRKVQFLVIFGTLATPRPWPWIGSRSYQHAQYVQDYQQAQPCDCSLMQYRNITIWISWNLNILRRTAGLRQAVAQIPCYHSQPSVWAPRETGPRKVQFSELQKLRDLDLGSDRGHTGAHMWSRSTHTPH